MFLRPVRTPVYVAHPRARDWRRRVCVANANCVFTCVLVPFLAYTEAHSTVSCTRLLSLKQLPMPTSSDIVLNVITAREWCTLVQIRVQWVALFERSPGPVNTHSASLQHYCLIDEHDNDNKRAIEATVDTFHHTGRHSGTQMRSPSSPQYL